MTKHIAGSPKLALHGGEPAVRKALPIDSTIGEKERKAVDRVMRSRSLSGFYGSWGPQFHGGAEVKSFEAAWAQRFKITHAVSVNSATSGLIAALGAIGLSPGDEVIVPPYTMSATVVAPLFYGGIPVFADVEPDTFCLNPGTVRAAITPKTRAIIAVNLFGHPARLHELATLAIDCGLALIEDNSQGPLAEENGVYAGTIGDIGIFSLNYHKHIHTGEGGMCVTRNDEFALRLQAIRNHAENIVENSSLVSLANMIGQNYRMTEISAAIGLAQLEKIDAEVGRRQDLAQTLSAGLTGLEGLKIPLVRKGCRHVYYVWGMKFDEAVLGVSRADFSRALLAEGFPLSQGYVRPLYRLPVFQQRIAVGRNGWPFTLSDRKYTEGMCPVAEQLYEKEMVCFEPCAYRVDDSLAEQLIDAVRKVHSLRHQILA